MVCNRLKKGVSLVTVLMFMLVATIAATATYKWLSSESFSSAHRMVMAEAHEASRAGLESTRSWMLAHSNDVGALIRQYFKNNKRPIKLNNVVPDLTNGKQSYSVWLTGVNVQNATYRMKIVSIGSAREGSAKYGEISILKVNGLYRVVVPMEQKAMHFNKAFHGKIGNATSNNPIQSAVINGNLTGNIPRVEEDLLVTGNVNYQGSLNQGGDLYVAGNFTNQGGATFGNSGDDDKVVFIGGNITNCAGGVFGVMGDLFVTGNIPQNCKIYVRGNMTMQGELSRTGDAHGFYVGGNMVFTEASSLNYQANFDGGLSPYTLTNGLSVSIPDFGVGMNFVTPPVVKGNKDQNNKFNVNLDGWARSYSTAKARILKQSGSIPYGLFFEGTSEATAMSGDAGKNRMMSLGTSTVGDHSISQWSRNNDHLKNIGNYYWDRIDKMRQYGRLIAENGEVPQPILLNDEDGWLAAIANNPNVSANQTKCGKVGHAVNANSGLSSTNIDAINKCYTALKNESPDDLYGGFLVVQINNSQLNDVGNMRLSGHIVLVFRSKPSQMRLPPTEENAVVMLYFMQGAADLQAADQNKDHYKYFIYSNGDIRSFLDKLDIQGSLIMANGSTLGDLNSGGLHYDENVMLELSQAGFIAENPEYTQRVDGGESPVNNNNNIIGQEEIVLDEYDVSIAPQLTVAVETQYKNDELDPETLKEGEYNDVEPSIVIMPRVIYVTRDMVGKLSDYYSVLNLNGATETRIENDVECAPAGLNPTQPYDGTVLVPPAIYACSYVSSRYGSVPFWVWVNGMRGQIPNVSFERDDAQISPGGSGTTVSLVISGSENMPAGTKSITVRVDKKPAGWTISPMAGVTKVQFSYQGEGDFYRVTFDGSQKKIPLFQVNAAAGAANENVGFYLVSPMENCNIGEKSVEWVYISGTTTIHRENLSDAYCLNRTRIKTTTGVGYDCSDVLERPNCGESVVGNIVWVAPDCIGMQAETENEEWSCGTNNPIRLKAKRIPKNCELFIADTSIEIPEHHHEYWLPASLKRKPFQLSVKAEGATGVSFEVKVRSEINGEFKTIAPIKKENGSFIYEVFAYDAVDVTADPGSNSFSTWRCAGESCNGRSTYQRETFDGLAIQSDVTLVAHFNEKDNHCFYDSFKSQNSSKGKSESFEVFCPNSSYENCIDRCKSGTHCSMDAGYDAEANWTLVYANHASSMASCENPGKFSCLRYRADEFVKPQVNDNTISAPADVFGSMLSLYSPSVLLHRVQAGFDGTMTMKISVPAQLTEFLQISGKTDDYNDGIILRSNRDATEYLSLNIYGQAELGDGINSYARVCYATQKTVSSGNSCIETYFKDRMTGNKISVTSLKNASVRASLKGSRLEVSVNYSSGGGTATAVANFDLSKLSNTSLSYGKAGNDFIGLKLFNPYYRYRDISWNSDDYSDSCFAAPRVYCSFVNEYLGGIIPQNKDVNPWVGMSSWFDDQGNCSEVEYYYNGCDLDDSKYASYGGFNYAGMSGSCASNSDYGGFWYEGKMLKDSTYNFEDEGLHRIAVTKKVGGQSLSGFMKNASVQVQCGSISEGVSTYASDCGTFYVGDVIPCEENFGTDEKMGCSGSTPCELMIPGSQTVNVRDAKISVTIGKLDYGEVKLVMVDANNVQSNAYTISSIGSFTFEANDYSDVNGFDPQKVRGVILTGSSYYELAAVESSCPNAPGIGTECTVEIDGSGTGFNLLTPNIRNADAAVSKGCSIREANNLVDGVSMDCPPDGHYHINMGDLYTNINNGSVSSRDISFVISMMDKNGNMSSCRTNTLSIKRTEAACSISKTSIYEGEDLPTFKYLFKDCPKGGCKGSVKLGSQFNGQSVLYTNNCSVDGGSCDSSVITLQKPEPYLSEGTDSYQLMYMGQTVCEKSFGITKLVPATASRCRIENKVFRADITGPNHGTNVAKIYYFDPVGHQIGSDASLTTSTRSLSLSLANISTDGIYTVVLKINDEEACSVLYTVGNAPEVKFECPALIDKQDPTSAVMVRMPSKVPGCEMGCSWSVTPSTLDGSDDTYKYNGGDISFYDPSAKGQKTYSLKVKNLAGKSKTCDVNVSYAGCHCKCAHGCDNVITTGWDESQWDGCYFTRDFAENVDFVGAYNNSVVEVNGKSLSNGWFSKEVLEISRVDGGWYIQFKVNESLAAKFSGGKPECTEADPVSSSAKSSSSTKSSSSAKSSASTPVTELVISDALRDKVLEAGTYRIPSCWSGATGTKVFSVRDGSSDDCVKWFSPAASWSTVNCNGTCHWGTCNGQIKVTFPMTISIPAGQYLKIGDLCW